MKRMSALLLAAALTISAIPMRVQADEVEIPDMIVEEQNHITLYTQSKTSGFSSNYTLVGSGAEDMVAVTSEHNHLVTSFGLKVMAPVYDLMQRLIDNGVMSGQKFSVDPRPVDDNVPANFLQNFVFNKFMYTKQETYEKQLEKLGLMNKDAFTCTCYMDEVGNKPKMGDILSWSESSAVVYANSV